MSLGQIATRCLACWVGGCVLVAAASVRAATAPAEFWSVEGMEAIAFPGECTAPVVWLVWRYAVRDVFWRFVDAVRRPE
jgi:hypothetical protein